ncbi:MAG: hypothetical protein KDD89_11070, partial [Anaerolineales bacterium]|nr:hypothetical protein [Anaerolineales bacterium]
MRRTLLILFVLQLGGLALVQLSPASGQDQSNLIPITPPANWERIITTVPDPTPIPVELTPLPGPPDALAPNSIGSDSCEGAVALPYQYGLNEEVGDQTAVGLFGINANDPSLSGCFARPTTNSRGYRSAWYRFDNFELLPNTIIPRDGSGVKGRLVVRTEPNDDYRRDYDTVIALYQADDCTNLAQLTCNDDNYALFSQASIPIVDGQRYYIQVVDFQAASSGPISVKLVAEVIPDSEWTSRPSLPQPTSRNAVVAVGSQVYVIGGQTLLQQQGRRTGRTYRYDTNTNQMTELATMPAGKTLNGEGYSNGDAQLIGQKIHMPSGDIGALNTYDGTHWVYDIATNSWEIYSAANGQVDPPWGPPPGSGVPGFTEVVPFALGNQEGMYVVGGLTGDFFSDNASARTYRYVDGDPGFWQTLSSMITPRYAHTGVVLGNGRVCVVGGLTDGPSLVTNGECYFPTSAPPGWQVSVGDLNVPRYLAGSALGPDGRWYVFGGYDANNNPVQEIEVFDPNTATWNILGQNYHISSPPLGWVRGEFVGESLWLFGGEQAANLLVSHVQSNRLPVDPRLIRGQVFLPLVGNHRRGATLTTAVALPLNYELRNSFTERDDIYQVYFTDVGFAEEIVITLDHIPYGSDYDVLVYNENKQLV